MKSFPLAVAFALLLGPPVAAQTPSIVDTPQTRADYHALAERLSMDIRFELEDINVKTVARKVQQYAKLGLTARSPDAVLGQLAKDTSEMYQSLESVHLIFEARELDFTAITLELLSKMVAQQRLAADNQRLLAFQRKVWPKLLPYAKQFAGPPTSRPVFDLYTVGRRGSTARTFEIKNGSKATLTGCTLVAEMKDAWGQTAQVVFYRESWAPGDGWEVGGLRQTVTWLGSKCTLYANELTAEDVSFSNPNFGAAEKAVVKSYLDAFPNEKKTYAGGWKLEQPRRPTQTGKVTFLLRGTSDPESLLSGPQVEATVWDPDKPKFKFVVNGRFYPLTEPDTGKLKDLQLVLYAGPPTSRIFRFRLDDGKLVGTDNLNNQFKLAAK